MGGEREDRLPGICQPLGSLVEKSQAEQAASNQMDEADRYALEMLKRLQAQLAAFTTTIEAGIESLTTAREPEEAPASQEQTPSS